MENLDKQPGVLELVVVNIQTNSGTTVTVQSTETVKNLYHKVALIENLRNGFFELVCDGVALPRGSGGATPLNDTHITNNCRLELLEAEPVLSEEEIAALPLCDLKAFLQACESRENQALGATVVRKIVAREGADMQPVFASGFVPLLVKLLAHEDSADLQLECAWVLSNIASGPPEMTAAVVRAGAVPLFVKHLESPYKDVAEQCTWGLGNIAGDSVDNRNVVLAAGALPRIIALLTEAEKNNTESILCNASWTLSNLFRGVPKPPIESVQLTMPTLSKLARSTIAGVVEDAVWALSYCSDGPQNYLDAVLDEAHNLVPRFLELIDAKQNVAPSLRALGNLVTGSDRTTQKTLDYGLLPRVVTVLKTETRMPLIRECCWLLSNVAAGSSGQIQDLLNSGAVQLLKGTYENHPSSVGKEILFVITNLFQCARTEQIEAVEKAGAFAVLHMGLEATEETMRQLSLEAMQSVVNSGNRSLIQALVTPAVLEKVEQLEDTAIAEEAAHFLSSLKN